MDSLANINIKPISLITSYPCESHESHFHIIIVKCNEISQVPSMSGARWVQ